MKKILFIVTALLLLLVSGCGAAQDTGGDKSSGGTAQAAAEVTAAGKHVTAEIGGQKAVLVLNSSAAAARLYDMLPLTLTFKDFNNTEKIAYTKESLTSGLKPEGHQPQAGDLCIYGPWGNLCLFYKDFRSSGDLFYLGQMETGLELFAEQQGDFEVRLYKNE